MPGVARLIAVMSLALVASVAAEGPPDFAGSWRINHEESESLAVKYDDSSWFDGLGAMSANATVGGVPIPLPGGQEAASGATPSKDPGVLKCLEMDIEQIGEELHLTYRAVGGEKMRAGHYRGRNTKWSNKQLTQKYESTERKVKKTWNLRSDGRLLVTVKINPKNDKARTYRRVFDRIL